MTYSLARAYECRNCHAVSMVPLDSFSDLSEEAEPQLPCFNCGEMAGYIGNALYWDGPPEAHHEEALNGG